MDAKPLSLGAIVRERQRFIVPIYQRTYSWTVQDQLEPLFDQIEDKANEWLDSGKVEFHHYMGALLVIPESDAVFGRIQKYDVVDGQQRLTSFHLCFAALKDLARDCGFDDISKHLNDLIVHGDDVPMEDAKTERYKLQPTSYDRVVFRNIIDLTWQELKAKYPESFFKNGNIKHTGPLLPLAAYGYIWQRADAFITADESDRGSAQAKRRLQALSAVLFENFRLIVITLGLNDDAQVIFQTLNSGGKPLAAMDLVRNDVFHRASRAGEDEEELMNTRWCIFEKEFWKAEQTQGRITKPRIDFYLAHTLAAEQGKAVSLGELYSEYKSFVSNRQFSSADAELDVLTRYISTYQMLAEPAGDTSLARLARRLNVFDVTTASPAVLVIDTALAEADVKDRLYVLLASYVIRRALCNMTPKNYNKVFVELAAYLRGHGVSEASFSSYFEAKREAEATLFPTDKALSDALIDQRTYKNMPQRRLRLILEELEFAGRDVFNVNGTLQEGLSIEHVMPVEWPEYWPLEDGRSVPRDRETGVDEPMRRAMSLRDNMVHALGNLTLLTLPANVSALNKSFDNKRERLSDSLLNMNASILKETVWDESAIRRRARSLGELAVRIWPSPQQ